MIDAPLALAFTAGLVATVNPCGFAMLPAYLSWYLGTDTNAQSPARVGLADRLGRALGVAATVSAGFLVVFGITGALVTVGIRSFVDYVPWAAMLIGIALAGLGVALLAGRDIAVALPKPQAGTTDRRRRSMLVFGASYAVASLSCTLPVFLSVVASTFTRTDTASGIAGFVAYAIGMSLMLATVTLALALTQHSLVAHIRTLSRHVSRVAGALLVVAGGYIVYYWAFNLSTDPGQTAGAGPARYVEQLSARVTTAIEDFGWQAALVAAIAVVGTAVTVVALRDKPAPDQDSACCSPDAHNDDPGDSWLHDTCSSTSCVGDAIGGDGRTAPASLPPP